MGFEARGDTIKGLLATSRQYRIPRFQREFSWEESNYKEFYVDILKQIVFEDSMFKTNQYYFGNMLFLGDKENPIVDVIDGQQRLTTSTIFLAALRDTLLSLNQKQAKEYANTIQNEYIAKVFDGEVTRKIETKTSFPYFSQKIQDIKESRFIKDPKSEEEEGIQRTYNFFFDAFKFSSLSNYVKEYIHIDLKEADHASFLKVLRDQLLNSEIIAVFINEKNQANQIFENINSKGKPLSAVDLIKNSIFSKIPISESSGVDDLAETWNQLTQKISDSDQIAGFNEFFLHYWKATYPADSANGKNLYMKYSDKFGASDSEEITELVLDLEKKLDIYVRLSEASPTDFRRQEQKEEHEYLTALKYFNAVQVRVPLLALYNSSVKIRSQQKNEILKFLAYFHFIAFGTSIKFRSNLTTTPFKNFAEGIKTSKNKNDVSTAFNALKASLIIHLNKDDVRSAFENLNYSKNKARKTYSEFPTAFIMKEIAKDIDQIKFCDSLYSIEHIIDEEEDQNSKNIGNLLILEKTINDKLAQEKNKNNTINKIDFYKESHYKIVDSFIKEYANFESKDIGVRANKLFNYFWDNLWSHFVEAPDVLKGVWIGNSDIENEVIIRINENTIDINDQKYAITGYEKNKNTYTIFWDVDKVENINNPQPLIFEYIPKCDEMKAGITYHRQS